MTNAEKRALIQQLRPSAVFDDIGQTDIAISIRSLRALCDALEATLPRPIATAPNDGRLILVVGGRYTEPEIVEADGAWWQSGHAPSAAPTVWWPLPETDQ